MEDLRFGLIGYGLWGTHHARAIAATPGAKLAAIAVPPLEGQEAAKTAHPDAHVFGDFREMLADEPLDAVTVAVPNHLHHEVGCAVLDADKHLLIEKPMALTVEHCDQLIAMAKDRHKVLAVDHEMRLSLLWHKVKQLIADDAIGTPQYVLLELSRFPYRFGSEGWRFDIQRVGNWILEEPIHFFDLVRWYLQDHAQPLSVYARASSRQVDDPQLQDNFSTIINFSGGAYAVISQTLAAFEHHVTCKVAGTRGAIWANWSAPDARHDKPVFGLRYSTGDDPTNVIQVPYEDVTGEVVELQQQIAAFADCIRNGGQPPVTGEDGRWAVAMCLAAQASVDFGVAMDVNGNVAQIP